MQEQRQYNNNIESINFTYTFNDYNNNSNLFIKLDDIVNNYKTNMDNIYISKLLYKYIVDNGNLSLIDNIYIYYDKNKYILITHVEYIYISNNIENNHNILIYDLYRNNYINNEIDINVYSVIANIKILLQIKLDILDQIYLCKNDLIMNNIRNNKENIKNYLENYRLLYYNINNNKWKIKTFIKQIKDIKDIKKEVFKIELDDKIINEIIINFEKIKKIE